MINKSAGILMYRLKNGEYEFLLVHPGGPYWVNKDDHSWSIPKGEFEDGEEPFEAAVREFREETGSDVSGEFIELLPVKQPSGKTIYTWAVEGNMNASGVISNLFEMEWPPGSGKTEAFPEVDRAEWFSLNAAKQKVFKGQIPILEQLHHILHASSREE